MEALTNSDPFDFKDFGIISIYKARLVQHVTKQKPKGIINYYRFKVIPLPKNNDDSGRLYNHMETTICDTNPSEKMIVEVENDKSKDLKYIHLTCPVIIPVGTDVWISVTKLEKDDNEERYMYNIIWLSAFNGDKKPTVSPALMMYDKDKKKRIRSFIGSNYALLDIKANVPVVVYPMKSSAADKIFGIPSQKLNDVKMVGKNVTNREYNSLLNKTLYMLCRHFISTINSKELVVNGVIDERDLLCVLSKSNDIPKEYTSVTIESTGICFGVKKLTNSKGLRKYKNTVVKCDFVDNVSFRNVCYSILISYMFGKRYGECWYTKDYTEYNKQHSNEIYD